MREVAVRAVVQKVVPSGNHGPFAVATSEQIEGSITFSLEPTIWQEDEWPEQGTVVLLGKLRKKRAGWRAKTGRFFRPSDEQTERRNEMTKQYRRIAGEEINAAAEHDPQRALLMVLANSTLVDAERKATGEQSHEPKFHESGWSIAIETPQGVVGLWSCWLNNQFYLGYPKRTSFLVAALPEKAVIRIANKYRRENADKFLVPPKEDFGLEESRRLLTGFKESELAELLRQNGVQTPSFRDGAQIVDQLIMDTLGVELARPVLQVDATAVGENYEGEYKDPDKQLVKNSVGQIVAYRTRESRLWAKFYSSRVVGDKGRVWVDHSDWNSNGHHFDVVRDGSHEGLENIYYGHDYSRGISTFPFSFWSEYAPDGPTTEPEVIQSYREKFLALACEIARRMGGANAVNINYGFVLVPEQLPQLGYGNIAWLKGRGGVRQGWGNEVVRAEKATECGKETVILKSGNSLVPWSTIRRAPCAPNLTAEKLIERLTF